MKRLVLIFCFLGQIVLPAFGQCVADAGESVHRCSPDSIVHLGGSPTAIVGTAPYTYEWTIDPIPTGLQSVP